MKLCDAQLQGTCVRQLQQQEVQRRQAQRQAALMRLQLVGAAAVPAAGAAAAAPAAPGPRHRTACTVRVNNLHTAEAVETDV